MRRLDKDFFRQDPIIVARELLGQHLVYQTERGPVVGRIVETEAYLGADDPACHSFGGRRTPRTETMFLPGGHHYVYFIYGMYFCYNIVTEDETSPSAVLVRAVEPVQGLEFMQQRRPGSTVKNLTSGPGKLCMAYGIDKSINGRCMQSSDLYVAEGQAVNAEGVIEDSRIGIDSFGDAALWPLRFFEKDNPFVSVKKRRIYEDGL